VNTPNNKIGVQTIVYCILCSIGIKTEPFVFWCSTLYTPNKSMLLPSKRREENSARHP
jgi:hypothetical protein